MRTFRYVASFIVASSLAVVGWNTGCSNHDNGTPSDDGGGNGASSGGSGGGSGSGTLVGVTDGAQPASGSHICTKDGNVCTTMCSGTTTISGKVFDPAGKNPVYNAAVWVPYQKPGPMPLPITCNCSELYSGGFVGSYALTDATGAFKINGAPAPNTGSGEVPFVVQVGKWRYQTTINVACGQDNKVPDGDLRLPQRRTGAAGSFQGDLPNMAFSTGGADTLECLLTRIGVDNSEYVAGSTAAPTQGGPHVHIFQGSPVSSPTMAGAPQSSTSLWDTPQHLANYDVVLLSCEGSPTSNTNPQNLYAYGGMGGRVFASHYHYQWFLGAPFPNFGNWYTQNSNQLSNPTYGVVNTKLPNGVPFPEGVALDTWLKTTGAYDSTGELPIAQARHNVDVPYASPQNAVPWMNFDVAKGMFLNMGTSIYDPLTSSSTLYFSWDTQAPNNPETTCGRFVYSDLHVGGNSGDYGESPNSSSPPAGVTDIPTGCNGNVDLSPQEKALEFILFDLTSCLAPPGANPMDAGVSIAL